jgi:hypothetical protein
MCDFNKDSSMDKKIKTTEIVVKEMYGDNCFRDSMKPGGIKRGPKGFVEVYEVQPNGEKVLVSKSNLILYLGREWVAQRIMNLNNPSVTPTKDEILYWFGLGDGGVDPADPLDPIAPIITDTDLYSRLMINATDASCSDYHVTGVGYPDTGYYKKYFDSVEFEQDNLNDDKWLVIKITFTVGVDDANGGLISEAGLFSAESDSGGYPGPFSIFARVTFPTIIKTDDRQLIFRWYLFV